MVTLEPWNSGKCLCLIRVLVHGRTYCLPDVRTQRRGKCGASRHFVDPDESS